MASTVPSSASAWAKAARATTWVCVDRWYGIRTSRSASTTAGSAARYPTRPPASAKALLIVRETTSRGRPSSNVVALGVPGRANSAYASSTTTSGVGTASYTASTRSNPTAVPVGLFGEQMKTTCGLCWRTCRTTRSSTRS